MKIASTLTNTAPSETGLPSLLSCGSSATSSSNAAKPTTADARKTDPAQTGQSITAFDAVLAMFSVPQNLPQQPPLNLVTQSTSANANSLATASQSASSSAAPNLSASLIDSNSASSNVAAQALNGDLALSRATQSVAALVPAPPSAPVPSSTLLATAASVDVTSGQSPNTLAPTLADSTATTSTTDSGINGEQLKQSSLLTEASVGLSKAATASTAIGTTTGLSALLQKTATTSVTSSETVQATHVETSPVVMESSVVAPQPVSELRGQHAQGQSLSDAFNAHLPTTLSGESSTLSVATTFVATTTVANTLQFREFPSVFGRFEDSRTEAAEEKDLRRRHATTDANAATELAASANQPTELADHGSKPINVPHLTEQISAAMQTHGSELAAGQPVEVHLRLDPPELGMVRVHLRLTDDVVSVRFIAGDEAATKMLQSQLPDLRQSLAERGLAFSQCNVSCDSQQQQQQQSSNFGRESQQPTFAMMPAVSRSWSPTSFVARSINTRSDRVDILA